MAILQLSPITYMVAENGGNAMVIVECIGATLTFDISVVFQTIAAGSTATGIIKFKGSVMNIVKSFCIGYVSESHECTSNNM